jgi:hypothetical protein
MGNVHQMIITIIIIIMYKGVISQGYRIDFLYELPKNAVCAELGVARGDWSRSIVEITKPRELWLVDKFVWDFYHKPFIDNYFFIRKNTKVKVIKGIFEEVEMPIEYFDWVYLDLNHLYEPTKIQLRKCFDLLKPNGILTGDDYGVFSNPPFSEWFPYGDKKFKTTDFPIHEGLTKAVDEFIDEYSDKIHVEYLNKNELKNSKQYKIRKL